MRLMGISRLAELARRADGALDGAAAALAAELEEGAWQSMDEIAKYFPLALIRGTKVRISISGGYRVDFIADCEAQMIFIEGAQAEKKPHAGKRGSEAA
jgi:hypothetical protein